MDRSYDVPGFGDVSVEVDDDWKGVAEVTWIDAGGRHHRVKIPGPILRVICKKTGAELVEEGLNRLLRSLDDHGIS